MRQLADTTAWHLSRRVPELRGPFDLKTVSGKIGTCPIVTLELLQSARNGREFDERRLASSRNFRSLRGSGRAQSTSTESWPTREVPTSAAWDTPTC
jgi:hypothetical protein